jgi:hypothetical protein
MNWFQRYGIPGAYGCGMSLIWFSAFYHCRFTEMLADDRTVATLGAVLAGIFVPVGYFVSLLGQILYHLIPGLGLDTQARRLAGIRFPRWRDRWLEYRQEAISVYQVVTTSAFPLDHIKWLLGWMGRRMDMVVINTSIVLATPIALIAILSLGPIFGFRIQVDRGWCLLGALLSIVVLILTVGSLLILRKQLVDIEAHVLSRITEGRVDSL